MSAPSGVLYAGPTGTGAGRVSGNLSGLDPRIIAGLRSLATRTGRAFQVTSGERSTAHQAWLVAHPQDYPVAAPGTSLHEGGYAADVLVDGKPIQSVFSPRQLEAAGLYPQPGDAIHVQSYPSGTSLAAAKAADQHDSGGFFNSLGKLAKGAAEFGPSLERGDAPGIVQGAKDLASSPVGAAGQAVNGVAGDVVDGLASMLGLHLPQIALTAALVIGAVVLLITGVGHAAGLTAQDVKKTATAVATRGAA